MGKTKWFRKSFPLVVVILGLGFLGGLLKDIHEYSQNFMQDNEIRFAKRLDQDLWSKKRAIASIDLNSSSFLLSLPYSLENKHKIKGVWSILKIMRNGHLELRPQLNQISLDFIKNANNQNGHVIAHFENLKLCLFCNGAKELTFLIYDFKVQKNGDLEATLLRKENESLVIMHVKKIHQSVELPEKKTLTSQIGEGGRLKQEATPILNTPTSSVNLPEETELQLISIFRPSGEAGKLSEEQAQGKLKIKKGSIEYLSINHFSEGVELNLNIKDAPLENNYFTYTLDDSEQKLSGLINRTGKGYYTLTLINGPHRGAKFTFMAEEMAEEEQIENGDQLASEKSLEDSHDPNQESSLPNSIEPSDGKEVAIEDNSLGAPNAPEEEYWTEEEAQEKQNEVLRQRYITSMESSQAGEEGRDVSPRDSGFDF